MSDDASESQWAVKANMRGAHRFIRLGAKCIVINRQWRGGIEVRAMTRGGRNVFAWVNGRDLENFRPEFVSAAWLRGDAHPSMIFATREEAQAAADAMNSEYGATPLRRSAWFRGTATAAIETTETAP